MPIDRSERRRRGVRRRGQRRRGIRRLSTAAGVLVLAVLAGISLAGGGAHKQAAPGAKVLAPRRHHPQVLHPPGPIPGYLLIADRGNNRMLLVDSSRRIYWQYPGPDGAAMPFVFDDDTFFGPRHDRIISNQEDQHTIQIISFPGRRLLWRYGHVNIKSGRTGYLNTPDDAYLLPNNRVTVADAYNCRVLFLNLAHRIVRQYGTTGNCRHDPPRYLGAVNGATPLPDGGTLISEIAGSWIDDISASGRLRWSVQAPVAYPSDPQLLGPNRILLADYALPGQAIIMTRTGRVLWRYGPASGPGALNHPSLATLIAPDLVAINDDYRHRVVLVSISKHKIVWQYGHTDQRGTAPGYLNTPDGLDLLQTKDAQASPKVAQMLATDRTPPPQPRAGSGIRVSVPFRLPAPVEREVAVPYKGTIIVAGGLDAGGASTAGVFQMDPSTGRLASLGSVPQPFHDAAGAIFGSELYIFGGGAAQSSASVQRFNLVTHRGSVVASLPRALSDIAAASTSTGVYLIGGYDGHSPRPEIYRTTDGTHFRLAARLPIGLRYPAVTTAGDMVVIAGGTAAAGASNKVYVLDSMTQKLRLLGLLPAGVAHAQALTIGADVYVAGGVDSSGQITGTITKLDPTSGRIVGVPGSVAVSDAAAVVSTKRALLIGGATTAGTTGQVHKLGLH